MMEEISYYINEEKRIVICKYQPIDPMEAILNIFDNVYFVWRRTRIDDLLDEYEKEIDKAFVGRATCHPEDDFDIEYGKKIALIKAKEKYYKKCISILEKLNIDLTENSIEVLNKSNRLKDSYKHEINYIKKDIEF